MITVNDYCKKEFGEKLYKLSLDGGMTCPNRDGTFGTRGCIFCSAGGSGDFTPSPALPIEEQINMAKQRVSAKFKGSRYIAYFQAYTNTYAPADYLRRLFLPILARDDIAVLDIATRPDCLPDAVIELIDEMNRIKPVWIELGLQTSNPETAKYIRRGYDLPVYDNAVAKLRKIGVHIITHVILGLPGESKSDMENTVRHVVESGANGIKLQLLHVLKGTDLADEYIAGKFKTLEFDEYIDILRSCVQLLPSDMVVHRITGDGPKSLLLAPMWSADKKRVLNAIHKEISF